MLLHEITGSVASCAVELHVLESVSRKSLVPRKFFTLEPD